jgi:hypothetical protein
MNAGRFERDRCRIESEPGRSNAWRKRALQHLIRQAGAEPISTGKRVVAYRLPDGKMVCKKRRFQNEQQALDTLRMIAAEHEPRTKQPVRAYACYACMGWHITSWRNHALATVPAHSDPEEAQPHDASTGAAPAAPVR